MPDYVAAQVLEGADNRTLTDLYNHLQYLGGHRWRCNYYDSGVTTLPANTTSTFTSVSGLGIYWNMDSTYLRYVAYYESYFCVYCDDTPAFAELGDYISPNIVNEWGFTSTGVHSLGKYVLRTLMWDTTGNEYEIRGHDRPAVYFRNTLEVEVANLNSSTDAEVSVIIHYYLFVASKQALLALDPSKGHVHAKVLKKMLDKRVSAVEVHTMGQFEKEEEIPRGEFIGTEKEYHLTELARKRPLTYVIITYPDNVELEKVLGRLKPKKILHDDILG